MKKPILEHLQNLPEEYREEAIRLFNEYWSHNKDLTADSQSDALIIAFPFIDPKWKKLYDQLKERGL